MAKKIEMLFPTYVYRNSLAGARRLNSLLEHEISNMLNYDKEGVKWSKAKYQNGYTSFGSLPRLHKTSKVFADFMDIIRPDILKFVRLLKWQINPDDIQTLSCWTNAMGKGSRHSMHTHPLSMISGVYYVNSPKGSAPFLIEDPRSDLFMAAPLRSLSAPRRDQRVVSVKPRSGDLILFESWMKHEVPEHRSDLPRLSVSFNLGSLPAEERDDSSGFTKVRSPRNQRVLNDSSL